MSDLQPLNELRGTVIILVWVWKQRWMQNSSKGTLCIHAFHQPGCTTSFTDRSMYHAGKTPMWERGCIARKILALFVQLSARVLCMELLQEWIPKSSGYCLAGSATCKLLFAGFPLCLSCPALKYMQLIYCHTCCPQGVFQNDLSLTLHYYHSLPSPFKSHPLPAFFPSEFKGVEEAELNHWASLALLCYGIESQSLAARQLHNKL